MTTDLHRARLVTLLLCALWSGSCGGAAPPHVAGAPRQAGGHLLLVGGGERPPEVVELFVRLSGGSEGSIVVLPLASEESRESGAYYQSLFGAAGAREVRVVHVDDARDAHRREYIESIDRAGGVWLGGGDQSRITSRLLDTPLMEAIRRLLDRGGVVGGTSAGTACQSDPMLTGDGAEDRIEAGNVATARGLGLFPGVVIDQHFVARQRQNRLISVVLENPTLVGIGIDEATAIWVGPDRRRLEVVGRGTVFVFDAREAAVARHGALLGASGVAVAVLVPGQRYDLDGAHVDATSGDASPPLDAGAP